MTLPRTVSPHQLVQTLGSPMNIPDLPSDPMKCAIDLRFLVGGLSLALAGADFVLVMTVRFWG